MLRKPFFIIVLNILFTVGFAGSFKLQVGDLLFQDLNCGILCDGIGEVTYGVNNSYMSHVGMIESINNGNPVVIEAIGKGVVETPIKIFLARSHDKNGKPMVVVGRVKPQFQNLIPEAITYARIQLGKPYNDSFAPNNGTSFYCSELIYKAFTYANHNQPIFRLNIMNFADPDTKQITPAWTKYFNQIHATPPQGQIGTNPGMMSRESDIMIVYQYGKLRIHH
jgi:hypothetical protein